MHNSFIAFGSNIGDSLAILEASVKTLCEIPDIVLKAKSSWYQTKAIGPPQPDYLNGCVRVHTNAQPLKLLQILFSIENQFGRQRKERWGARTLDLDLLLYDDLILNTPTLQIPHPRMRDRAFVLVQNGGNRSRFGGASYWPCDKRVSQRGKLFRCMPIIRLSK